MTHRPEAMGSEAERNRAIVSEAFSRWAHGGSVFDILDDAVEWTIAGSGASARTFHGKRDSYAWFFKMRHGRVVKATAFLDLATYDAAIAGERLPSWPAT